MNVLVVCANLTDRWTPLHCAHLTWTDWFDWLRLNHKLRLDFSQRKTWVPRQLGFYVHISYNFVFVRVVEWFVDGSYLVNLVRTGVVLQPVGVYWLWALFILVWLEPVGIGVEQERVCLCLCLCLVANVLCSFAVEALSCVSWVGLLLDWSVATTRIDHQSLWHL